MSVSFLTRTRRQGAKSVVGPITGIKYLIVPTGTPVSVLDVDVLLGMTEPPCCGEAVPFGGEVRSFGTHVPTVEQLASVPDDLWDATPLKEAVEPKREKLYKKYDKPEENVEVKVKDSIESESEKSDKED